ncbi:MAG: DUF429 domain-containing protein [Euryarchaeota archaeon]|nr:DUF429 domain-containing protein [Euryarchaeota archaeon]
MAAQPEKPRHHAVGIDLAWGDRNLTGLAHLVGPGAREGVGFRSGGDGWRLLESAVVGPLEGIVAWVQSRVPADAPCQIAIDAPLVATNPAGTAREADKAVAARFRRFKVACYPADSVNAARSIALREALEGLGFSFAPPDETSVWRGVFETFPTAAQLGLFDIRRPVRYKHGPIDVKRVRLRELQMKLARFEDAAVPLEETSAFKALLRTDPGTLRGVELKSLEDRLDAFLCGLVAVLAWSAPERLLTLGRKEEGAVTVPHPPPEPGLVI